MMNRHGSKKNEWVLVTMKYFLPFSTNSWLLKEFLKNCVNLFLSYIAT
jgi:hypothetical protein